VVVGSTWKDFDNTSNWGISICTSGARPTAHEGRHIYETDTGKTMRCTNVVGPVWEEVGGGGGAGDFMADGSVAMTGTLDFDGNNAANVGTLDLNDIAANTDPDITTHDSIIPSGGSLYNLGSSTYAFNDLYVDRILGSNADDDAALDLDFRGDGNHRIRYNGTAANELEFKTYVRHRFMIQATEILNIDVDELAMETGMKVGLNGVGGGTYLKDDASGNMELHVATGKTVKIVVG